MSGVRQASCVLFSDSPRSLGVHVELAGPRSCGAPTLRCWEMVVEDRQACLVLLTIGHTLETLV